MNSTLPHRGAGSLPLRCASAIVFSSLLLLLPADAARPASAQREHLTPEEVELVRDAQALDRRTEVFVKAAERRILLITNPQAAGKLTQKDSDKWGEMPKGTRAQLLSDVARILDEAITNIDDTAVRSPDSPLLAKALRKLADAAARFLPQLTPLRDTAQDERERERIERAIESAQEIIAAAQKLPPPPAKK